MFSGVLMAVHLIENLLESVVPPKKYLGGERILNLCTYKQDDDDI